MTDPVIPPAAIEAASEARYAHRDASGPYGEVRCRCGQSFRTGVEQLQHASQAILQAALPHLRPLVEAPVCDCYLGGFSPETYEGPQHHCPVHGHGNDLPTTECPVCLGERSLIATATKLGRQLGRQEALAEIGDEVALSSCPSAHPMASHIPCSKPAGHQGDHVSRNGRNWPQPARDTGKGDSA